MLFSKIFIPTLREAPSDADIVSAKLMIRAGMIRKLASGVYEYLPLGFKTLKKVEQIIREELNAIGGQEVSLPLLLPKELWEETGRWNVYGKELFRLKDRKDSEFCLGPTHEEAITDLARREIRSYRQLPVMFHQFGIKFRDEIRPRFGVMRSREFLMSDAYSFHTDDADLEKYYKEVFAAYKRICERCGFEYRPVEAASGAIGGSYSHEFMVLADTGEEEIAWCNCGYGANSEKAECLIHENVKQDLLNVEDVSTPNTETVEQVAKFLNITADKVVKTLVYVADGNPVIALVRGDDEINEIKLQALIGAGEITLADEKVINEIFGTPVGFLGPVGLKKKVKIIADLSVPTIANAVVGANKKDFHKKNVNFDRDYKADMVADIRKVRHDDICPRCKKEKLQFSRGIEVGHTFKLGTKYSKSMNGVYLDAAGKENLMVMGCYGIGVSRILAATIEQSYDENGIIWPDHIAPYEVIIVPVNYEDAKTKEVTDKIYKELSSKGLDVLIDDRDERAGLKFKDADLIGIPYRITIGEKNLANGNVEFKRRRDSKDAIKLLKPEEAISEVLSYMSR